MSDESGKVLDIDQDRVTQEVTPDALSGPGILPATSATAFAAANNAWCVTCVNESNTPPETAFL